MFHKSYRIVVGDETNLRLSTSKFCTVASTETSLRPHPQQFKLRIDARLGARDFFRASFSLKALMTSTFSPTSYPKTGARYLDLSSSIFHACARKDIAMHDAYKTTKKLIETLYVMNLKMKEG